MSVIYPVKRACTNQETGEKYMKTEKIFISNNDIRYDEVMDRVEMLSDDLLLDKKDALKCRLLVEETLGMVKAMTEEFIAYLHFEGDDKEFRVELTAKTKMNAEKKEGLLSVSSSGKNIAVKGLMGKISEIIENGVLNFGDLMNLNDIYSAGVIPYGDMGMVNQVESPLDAYFVWSLHQYRNNLSDAKDENNAAAEAWDELEKSIVASIADDVLVGVRKDHVTMTIIKKLEA